MTPLNFEPLAMEAAMSEFVTLTVGPAGGLTVPLDAFNLANELLTKRELLLVQVGDKLRIRNRDGTAPALSAEDQARIRQYKHHLLALISYQPPEPQ